MKWRQRIIYLVVGVCVTLFTWAMALELVTYDVNHYLTEFEKQGWNPSTGMDQENQAIAAEEIIRYLKGEKDDFQAIAVKDGELQELYDERERVHMEDVLFLFDRARTIRNVSLVLAIVLLGYVVARDPNWKQHWLRTLFYTGLANVDMMILLGLLIWLDFTKYFTYFHLLLFDNDLWILDPSRHVLIQLLPETFFINTAIKIGIYAMGALLVVGLAAWVIERRLEKGESA